MTFFESPSNDAQRIRENYEALEQRVRHLGGDKVRIIAVTKPFQRVQSMQWLQLGVLSLARTTPKTC